MARGGLRTKELKLQYTCTESATVIYVNVHRADGQETPCCRDTVAKSEGWLYLGAVLDAYSRALADR